MKLFTFVFMLAKGALSNIEAASISNVIEQVNPADVVFNQDGMY